MKVQMRYISQDLSYHSNEMIPCLVLLKTEKLAIRDNLGSVFEKIASEVSRCQNTTKTRLSWRFTAQLINRKTNECVWLVNVKVQNLLEMRAFVFFYFNI